MNLLFHPSRNTVRVHLFKASNDRLVMPDAVLIMLMAKIFQTVAGKFRAFITTSNLVLLCAVTKSIAADSTVWRKLVGQAAMAIVWIARTSPTKKPTDSGGLFVRFHHNHYPS